MKENTKIGDVDEIDLVFLLNEIYDKNYFNFDEKQAQMCSYPPKWLKYDMCNHKQINCQTRLTKWQSDRQVISQTDRSTDVTPPS